MIRILHILTSLDRGGIETMLMNYYRKIDRERFQFDFLIHREGKFAYSDEITKMGGHIYHIKKYNPFDKEYRRQLSHFFLDHKEYSIVHCHLNCLSALPLKMAEISGIPIRISHSHIIIEGNSPKAIFKKISRKFIPLYANEFFACSEDAGRWMFGKTPFKIMPNAIDLEKFEYNADKRKIIRDKYSLNGKKVIGHVGRLTSQKNQLFLLEICKMMSDSDIEFELVLIGEGEDENKIRSAIQEYKLEDHVLMLGSIPNVNDWLQAFDIFAFPSLYEGLGIVAIEAQASGLITICSENVPREVKLSENCYFISLNDKEKWINRIMLSNNDSRKVIDLSQTDYNISVAAGKCMDRYQELCFRKDEG